MIAMCGLDCSKCEFYLVSCDGCHKQCGKMFWGNCKIASCVIEKGYNNCSDCSEFPCTLLESFSYDEEHGDNGERIENLRKLVK